MHLQKVPHVVNFHITDKCNFGCIYCFSKFKQKNLPLEDAKCVIDAIVEFFHLNGICNGRINIAGGEPLLYPQLDAIIDYIHAQGLLVSVISNGSFLDASRIQKWGGKVNTIGLSIDALSESTNKIIGRCHGDKTITMEHLLKLADAIHANGIKLKINTVISKLNLEEDLFSVYQSLKPDKIKTFNCLFDSSI